MDLDVKIRANDQGLFVVTFFNELNPEKNLTERAVKYIFSKFGSVSEIQYTEHGRVLISYKEKEGALKAIEMVNMGTKYRVETWQPVKENEVVQSTKSEEEDSFIFLNCSNITPKISAIHGFIKSRLFSLEERAKIKALDFSWIHGHYMKIVFDSKMSKDEIMTRHQENPFKWPKGFGNFEFRKDLPIAYLICPKTKTFWGRYVNLTIFGKKKSPKILNIHILTVQRAGNSRVGRTGESLFTLEGVAHVIWATANTPPPACVI